MVFRWPFASKALAESRNPQAEGNIPFEFRPGSLIACSIKTIRHDDGRGGP